MAIIRSKIARQLLAEGGVSLDDAKRFTRTYYNEQFDDYFTIEAQCDGGKINLIVLNENIIYKRGSLFRKEIRNEIRD